MKKNSQFENAINDKSHLSLLNLLFCYLIALAIVICVINNPEGNSTTNISAIIYVICGVLVRGGYLKAPLCIFSVLFIFSVISLVFVNKYSLSLGFTNDACSFSGIALIQILLIYMLLWLPPILILFFEVFFRNTPVDLAGPVSEK